MDNPESDVVLMGIVAMRVSLALHPFLGHDLSLPSNCTDDTQGD